MTPVPDLILYARPECVLCGETRAVVQALLDERARAGRPIPALVERNIDDDPAWQRAYFATIPVIELGDRRLDLATSPAKLRRFLDEVLDPAPAPTT